MKLVGVEWRKRWGVGEDWESRGVGGGGCDNVSVLAYSKREGENTGEGGGRDRKRNTNVYHRRMV